MRPGAENSHRLDSIVVLLLFGVFVFGSPFTFWWAAMTSIWYLPYLLWLGFIVLIGLVMRGSGDDV
jgi:hypothetical protein